MKRWKPRAALYVTLLSIATVTLLTSCDYAPKNDTNGDGVINGGDELEEGPTAAAAWNLAELGMGILGAFLPTAGVGTVLVRRARKAALQAHQAGVDVIKSIEDAKTVQTPETFTINKAQLRDDLVELGLLESVEKVRNGATDGR